MKKTQSERSHERRNLVFRTSGEDSLSKFSNATRGSDMIEMKQKVPVKKQKKSLIGKTLRK